MGFVRKPDAARSQDARAEAGPETHRWVSLVLVGGGVQSLLRIGLAAATARLISPSETGLFQLALSLMLVTVAIGDPGLAEAAVRRPAQTRASRNAFFAVNMALGLLVGGALFVASGPICDRLGADQARPLLAVLSLLPPITALSFAPFVELRRNRHFRQIALVEVVATFCGCVACVVTAFRGGGAWGLVAYQIAWGVVRLGMALILSPVFPRPIFHLRPLRPVARFASHVWAARLAEVLVSQLDKVVVGALLGAAALGLYSRAYLLVTLPLNLIAAAVTTVLVPALARVAAERDALRNEFLATSRAIATITFPAFTGAAALAAPLVGVMFGRGRDWDWAGVAHLLAVMAPIAALDSLTQPQRSLLIARGRTGTALGLSLVTASLVIAGIALGAQRNLIGAAWGYAAATFVGFLLSSTFALRLLGAAPWDYARRLWRTAASAIVMWIAVLLLRPLLVSAGAPEIVQLASLVLAGGLIYLTCLGWARVGEVFGWIRGSTAT